MSGPPPVGDHVAAQLPADLKDLWFTTPDREALPTPAAEAELLQAQIYAEIERAAVLPPTVDDERHARRSFRSHTRRSPAVLQTS